MAFVPSWQTFTTLVQNSAAAVQGACSSLIDLTVGSPLRAIIEANSSLGLWLQWQLALLLQRQRLNTSSDADVDSWVGDYGLTRLPAIAATGNVTLSRFTTTASATVLPGATVRTGDGAQTFIIAADPTNSLWNPASGNYVVPPGTASITVPIQAQIAGTAGNVVAGAISLNGSSTGLLDTVTNASPLINGVDAESDAALKARFPNYIGSLSKTTATAIGNAVASVRQGLSYAIAANVDEVGAYKPGHFVVTIDDGTGAPSTDLKATVYTAVDQVRSICETFSVQSPTVTTVNVSLTLTAAAGYIKANMQGPLANAIKAYINKLPIGAPLYYTKLAQVIYDAIPGVANITNLTTNGATSDITGGPSTVLEAGTVAVN